MLAKCLLGNLLQSGIERQSEIVPRNRKYAAQRSHRLAVGIGFNMFVAGDSAQFCLVVLLEANLADVVRGTVIGRGAEFAQMVDIIVAQASYVPDHVRSDLAIGVMAEQSGIELHTWETVVIYRDARHFFIVQARTDRNAGEVVALFQQFLEALTVLG